MGPATNRHPEPAHQSLLGLPSYYLDVIYSMWISSEDPENFVRGGPTLTTVFLVEEGREYPNTTISWSLSDRHRNAIEMAIRWPYIECWLGSFLIFQGILTSIAKKSYSSVNFRGEDPDPLPPPPAGSAHVYRFTKNALYKMSLSTCNKLVRLF